MNSSAQVDAVVLKNRRRTESVMAAVNLTEPEFADMVENNNIKFCLMVDLRSRQHRTIEVTYA